MGSDLKEKSCFYPSRSNMSNKYLAGLLKAGTWCNLAKLLFLRLSAAVMRSGAARNSRHLCGSALQSAADALVTKMANAACLFVFFVVF